MSVPYYVGKIVDLLHQPSATNTIDTIQGLQSMFPSLATLFVVGAIANVGRMSYFSSAGERIVFRLRRSLFEHLLKQNISFFDHNRTGQLVSRLVNDASATGKSVTDYASDGIRNGVMAIVGSGMMALISPSMTTAILFLVPPQIIAAMLFGRYVKNLSKRTQDALAETTRVTEEKLSNIRTVKAFANEKDELNSFEKVGTSVRDLGIRYSIASGIFFSMMGLVGNMSVLAVLWQAGNLVEAGQVSAGALGSFILYTGYVGMSVAGLSRFYEKMMQGVGASTRVFEMFDFHESERSGGIVPNMDGDIVLKNVGFSFPERGVTIKDVSFSLQKGSIIAVVGPSGAGKSTVASLLMGFYTPSNGEIQANGIDLSTLDMYLWRRNIGYVSQEPVLFDGTIKENILYGNPEATMDQVIEASIQANAKKFINSFPKGFDTVVGERGVALSGGQKQRIALARAFLKNPLVLILDEPTSALDGESERLVQDALDRLIATRTVLIIAHRLSTIKRADNIIVMDHGMIVEQGTFDELIALKGLFNTLVKH